MRLVHKLLPALLLGPAMTTIALAQPRVGTPYADTLAEQQIEKLCTNRWPDNLRLREACRQSEREGFHAVERPAPIDIAGSDFDRGRRYCAQQWPDTFSLRAACERNQTEALRTLKDPPPVPYERRTGVRARCSARWPDYFPLRVACERNAAAGIETKEADEAAERSARSPDLSAGVADAMRDLNLRSYRTDCERRWEQNLPMVDLCERHARGEVPPQRVLPPPPPPPRDAFKIAILSFQQQDYATALQEWRPMAERGEPAAQYYLGLLYDQGLGVTESAADALRWYQLAADGGVGAAMHRIGGLYEEGRGVPADVLLAHAWYSRALTFSPGGEPFRRDALQRIDAIRRQLSYQQRAQADRMVLDWMPKRINVKGP